jgi:hypothetical protein
VIKIDKGNHQEEQKKDKKLHIQFHTGRPVAHMPAAVSAVNGKDIGIAAKQDASRQKEFPGNASTVHKLEETAPDKDGQNRQGHDLRQTYAKFNLFLHAILRSTIGK